MRVDRISFSDYRSIERAEIEFSPGVNMIYGDNAKGKTNVLEAIYSFARGKSFRSASEKELVRFGASGYSTELVFTDKVRQQSMSLGFADKKRQKKINGVVCDKLYDMIGRFCAVLFCPEHLDIVKGGPGERREFLNIAISQLDREYIRTFSKYKLILEGRNALLRKYTQSSSQKEKEAILVEIEVYSAQAAEAAAYVCKKREEYIRGISPFAEFFLGEMSDEREKLTLEYECDVEKSVREDLRACRDAYLTKLTSNVEREAAAGATLYGPHRDDIKISINSLDARTYASQGQQRSVSLSLKMAEGEMSKKETGEYPVFLFDDVLSELDVNRKNYLLSKIKDRQIIITGCDTVDLENMENVRFIRALGEGKYESRLASEV